MVRYRKSLAILTESSIVVTHDNGKEPNEWPREVFSEVGTNDEFVRQLADEFMELMGATSIFDPERQEVKDALMVLLIEGLLPAYMRLKEIKGSTGRKIPVLNRRQQFEGLAGDLWRAYKALMPKATKLLGYDLGFLFQKPPDFKKGEVAFRAAHPTRVDVLDHLLAQKANWHEGLKAFRDFVEHRGASPDKFAEYYKPEMAEFLFDSVWRTLASILPVFIASHFKGPLTIEEIPLAEQDPIYRRRFKWVPMRG